MDKTEFEKHRDEIEAQLKATIWRQHVEDMREIGDSTFSRRDLRLHSLEKAYPGTNLNRHVKRLEHSISFEDSKTRRAREMLAKILSKGFYSYLKLRKDLGWTKESFKVSPWTSRQLPACVALVNPGGLIWVSEGLHLQDDPVVITEEFVGFGGTGFASIIRANAAMDRLIDHRATRYMSINNLHLNGYNNADIVVDCLHADWVPVQTIRNCQIWGGKTANLDLTGCQDSLVSNVWCDGRIAEGESPVTEYGVKIGQIAAGGPFTGGKATFVSPFMGYHKKADWFIKNIAGVNIRGGTSASRKDWSAVLEANMIVEGGAEWWPWINIHSHWMETNGVPNILIRSIQMDALHITGGDRFIATDTVPNIYALPALSPAISHLSLYSVHLQTDTVTRCIDAHIREAWIYSTRAWIGGMDTAFIIDLTKAVKYWIHGWGDVTTALWTTNVDGDINANVTHAVNKYLKAIDNDSNIRQMLGIYHNDTPPAWAKPNINSIILGEGNVPMVIVSPQILQSAMYADDPIIINNQEVVWVEGSSIAMTAGAASGQKNVAVANGAAFAIGEYVVVSDNYRKEWHLIANIVVNTLVMTNNLVHSYDHTENGAVHHLIQALAVDGTDAIILGQGGYTVKSDSPIDMQTSNITGAGCSVIVNIAEADHKTKTSVQIGDGPYTIFASSACGGAIDRQVIFTCLDGLLISIAINPCP